MKKIFLVLCMVCSTIGAVSFAAVDLPSQEFDLGAGVRAVWNQDSQELLLSGDGKVDRSKWDQLKNTLKLTVEPIEKIEFGPRVQFPDDANSFFYKVLAKRFVIDHVDTSNITRTSWMFAYANNFNEDLSAWDLSKVVQAREMFKRTPALTNPQRFNDLSSLTDGYEMFSFSSVPEVILKKTDKLQIAQQMFWGSKVENVEIENTSSMTDARYMFYQTDNFLGGNTAYWDTSSLVNAAYMFNTAKKFNADLSNWNLSKLENAYEMFKGTTSLTTPQQFNDLSSLVNARGMFEWSSVPEVILKKTDKLQNAQQMFWGSKVENVEIENTSSITNGAYMFYQTDNFLGGNTADWDTSSLVNAVSMFSTAKKFNADLSNWNLSKLENAYEMFKGTSSLTSPQQFNDLSSLVNGRGMFEWSSVPEVILKKTDKLENAQQMFWGSKVENVEIENTSSITNGAYMFYQTDNFLGGNTADWDTSSLVNAASMFSTAKKFNADLSNWNLSKLENAYEMFKGTTSLTSPQQFNDLSSLVNGRGMFEWSSVPEVILKKTDKLQNAQQMFWGSKVENVEIENTSTITNIAHMFDNATNFNKDLSNWDLSSVTNARSFIRNTASFDASNYEGLLYMLDNSGLSAEAMGRTIHVSSTYCAAASVRNKLIAKGFDLRDNGLDCKLNISFEAPTKAHSGDITDTVIKVTALLPLDPTKVSVESRGTSIGNQDLACLHGNTENELLCTIKLTSTQRGNRLSISAQMDVNIENWKKLTIDNGDGTTRTEYEKINSPTTITKTANIDGYLIDRTAPGFGQVKIDTSHGIHSPKISLPTLPRDIGIGISHCVIRADELPYDENNHMLAGAELDLSLDASLQEHSLWIKCYDKLGNFSENEVRFPPIVVFGDNLLLRSDGRIEGTVNVYAPLNQDGSENEITRIWAVDDQDRTLSIGLRCRDYQGRTSAPFKNKPNQDQQIQCDFSFPFPSGKDEFALKIKARSQSGAEGRNTQSFFRDEIAPEITIEPEEAFTGGNPDFALSFKVKIFDAASMLNGKVYLGTNTTFTDINGGNTDISDLCEPLVLGDQNTLVCSFATEQEAKDGTLEIIAYDEAGNETVLAYTSYTIDKTPPVFSALSMFRDPIQYMASYKLSFRLNDAGVDGGVGLWKSDENYAPDAIAYGVSLSTSCENFERIGTLFPKLQEPFDFELTFTDATHNGKYLCLFAKDKVGNQTSSLLSSEKLNVNIAPTLSNETLTLTEHHTGKPKAEKTIITLQGADANGDALSYEIESGNDEGLFVLDPNSGEIKTVAGKELDYEAQNQHVLTIKVRDEHGLSTTAKVTINLTDIDENAPIIDPIKDQNIKKNREVTIPVNATDDVAIKGVLIEGLPNGLSYDPVKKAIVGKTRDNVKNRTITITATDNAGNETKSSFKLTVSSSNRDDDPQTPICYGDCSGGGGTIQIIPVNPPSEPEKDPKTDPTPDSTPTDKPKEIKYTDDAIYNPSIQNGQCYTRRPLEAIIDSLTIRTSEEYKKAQSFLWSYEMTRYNSVDAFRPRDNLTREEAAKIFSNFAINVLCRKPDLNLKINYTDTENADPTLKPYITLAYQLGVMKGSGMGDGEFRPFDSITKAEINAVLIRMILKSYLDESKSADKKRYSEYNKVATELGIIKHGAGMEKLSREYTALMLFRAYKNQVFEWMHIDYFSYVLKNRADFVK